MEKYALLLCIILTHTGCGVWPTACEYATNSQYYCWKNEYQDFCESGDGIWHPNTSCKKLGYTHHCTKEEVDGGLEDKWTVADGCDVSQAPPAGTNPGQLLSACKDLSYGICSELTSGDVDKFESECLTAGNSLVDSCSTPGFSCTDATGTSGGSTVTLNIYWSQDICDFPEFRNVIYLRGSCDSLAGTFSGDSESCCEGAVVPTDGGAYCM